MVFGLSSQGVQRAELGWKLSHLGRGKWRSARPDGQSPGRLIDSLVWRLYLPSTSRGLVPHPFPAAVLRTVTKPDVWRRFLVAVHQVEIFWLYRVEMAACRDGAHHSAECRDFLFSLTSSFSFSFSSFTISKSLFSTPSLETLSRRAEGRESTETTKCPSLDSRGHHSQAVWPNEYGARVEPFQIISLGLRGLSLAFTSTSSDCLNRSFPLALTVVLA